MQLAAESLVRRRTPHGCAGERRRHRHRQEFPMPSSHRGERVVEEVHRCAAVRCAREGDALPLPAGQVHSVLSNLRLVARDLRREINQ